MGSFAGTIFQSWAWRPEIIALLGLAATIYTLGWSRLAGRRSLERGHKQFASGWQLAAYLSGLVVVGLALMSPIDILAEQLFLMHMIQHLFLVMIAPPLLWLASPFPFLLWGSPSLIRRGLGRLLNRRAQFRRIVGQATTPVGVLLIFIACLWGWHFPAAYDAALHSDIVHDLEHLTFFATAMLYWWHVVRAAPRIHQRFSRGARLVYLLVTVPLNVLVGIVIAFAGEPIYTHYATVPRLWGLTVMQDQMLGGVIMWAPGSMMYLIAALILLGQLLGEPGRHPRLEAAERFEEYV